MHSTSLNTDMTIEQSGLRETFQISGITHAPLASFTTLAMRFPPSAGQEARVYLPSFGAPLTTLEAVAPFVFKGGTRKGHASQKTLPGNIMVTTAIIQEKTSFSFLENKYHKKYSCYPSRVLA